jgi:hypothetical protein
MTRVVKCLVLAVALVGVGSCSDDSGPVAGMLTVSLTTPNPGADGAILLTVVGPQAITSVAAGTGLRVFSQPLTTTTKLAVTGPLTNGAFLMIGVADLGQAGQYHITIQGIAASSDFRLRSLAGYGLTISH